MHAAQSGIHLILRKHESKIHVFASSKQIIGKNKLHRLASLALQATVSVAVDDASNLQDISDVAVKMGATIHVVVEVNSGQDRLYTGVYL